MITINLHPNHSLIQQQERRSLWLILISALWVNFILLTSGYYVLGSKITLLTKEIATLRQKEQESKWHDSALQPVDNFLPQEGINMMAILASQKATNLCLRRVAYSNERLIIKGHTPSFVALSDYIEAWQQATDKKIFLSSLVQHAHQLEFTLKS